MKVQEYKCNFCGECSVNCEEFLGLKQADDCSWQKDPVESTDKHICGACLTELAEFAKQHIK